MRYVAVSAAVFSSAALTALGSQVSLTGTSTTNNINNVTKPAAITQIIGVASASPAHTTHSSKPSAKLASADRPTAHKPVMVTINPGDSLSAIAAAHGSTVQRLFDANTDIDNPDLIFPGHQLRIPDPNEQLANRPMPAGSAAVTQSVQEVAPAQASARQSMPAQASAAAVASGSVWDSLAQCESSGNWSINTGNGFYGGLQFTLATWQGLGGTGLPNQASREEQIARAEMLLARSGWGNWPACSAKLGLR
jgi:LysM repeat protein